jgi:DNA-binding NtrC family response regulator
MSSFPSSFASAASRQRGRLSPRKRKFRVNCASLMLPLDLQAKLLRALDRGRIRPVGSSNEIQTDVRLALIRSGRITSNDVKACFEKHKPPGLFSAELLRSRPFEDLVRELEREHLIQLHAELGGDLEGMARTLGKSVRTLYDRFKRLGIRPGELH